MRVTSELDPGVIVPVSIGNIRQAITLITIMSDPDWLISLPRKKADAKAIGSKYYYTGTPCKSGHDTYRLTSSGVCQACGVKKVADWRAANPDRSRETIRKAMAKWRAQYPAYEMEWALANPIKALLQVGRKNAKARGVPFSLTEEDIIIPDKCPVLGIPLFFELGKGVGRMNPNRPSLDQYQAGKGYTKDNTNVISWRANKVKGDATSAELRAVADWMDSLAASGGM